MSVDLAAHQLYHVATSQLALAHIVVPMLQKVKEQYAAKGYFEAGDIELTDDCSNHSVLALLKDMGYGQVSLSSSYYPKFTFSWKCPSDPFGIIVPALLELSARKLHQTTQAAFKDAEGNDVCKHLKDQCAEAASKGLVRWWAKDVTPIMVNALKFDGFWVEKITNSNEEPMWRIGWNEGWNE